MCMERKILSMKAAGDAGEVTAEIATLNVKDLDGDVTLPGYFGDQDASIVLAHDWGTVQLGKGTITESDGKAVFSGKFNMSADDADARAVFSRLKFDLDNPPPRIEWSYGYQILKGGSEPFTDDDEYGDGQYLKPLSDGSAGVNVSEVSPVLRGAGIDTGTVNVKSHTEPLVEQVKTARRQLDNIDAAVATLYDNLATGDHSLSNEKAAVLADLVEGMANVRATVLPGLEKEAAVPPVKDQIELILRQEMLKFQRTLSVIRETEM